MRAFSHTFYNRKQKHIRPVMAVKLNFLQHFSFLSLSITSKYRYRIINSQRTLFIPSGWAIEIFQDKLFNTRSSFILSLRLFEFLKFLLVFVAVWTEICRWLSKHETRIFEKYLGGCDLKFPRLIVPVNKNGSLIMLSGLGTVSMGTNWVSVTVLKW